MQFFREYWDIVDLDKELLKRDEINEVVDATWDDLTTNTHILLEKAATDCKKSPNLADAKKLVNRLIAGVSSFSYKFAEKFNQKYGADALKQIKDKLDKCSPGWKVDMTQTGWYTPTSRYTGLSCASPYGPWEIKLEGTGGGGEVHGSYHIPFAENKKVTATFEDHGTAVGGLDGFDRVGTADAIISPDNGDYQIKLGPMKVTGKAWGDPSLGQLTRPYQDLYF